MNLGISGRVAFVAASAQGLGYACARSLAREGVAVILNGRDAERAAASASRLRSDIPGAQVDSVGADLTTTDGRSTIVGAYPNVDILVTNNAGPPPGELADWDETALIAALRANAVPAVDLMRAYIPGMRARRFGRIVNITSAMVKSPAADMGLSTSARAALTAISKSVSKEVAKDNVTVNNLLPERIDTPRQEFMAQRRMEREGIDRDEAYRQIASTIAAQRLGTPDEFGDACAFLCSAQAGYISGQNLQLDGGSYEGLI
ncbi:3-oxoacyl-[acyl-carrier protein] reductase [Branchiibius hedensis]|uniref:3-oxoacyl-[acyl-carrier protein] reductase n=1 Tax=Branchiibius hedensis TaxID=672460 RepID=A0A2Y8ZUN3_9MICO|nr:SDR family oxidoreductase [Branchiibius hedensis]PWJ26824.1 3-oxoacyl-[acyl-carrier protein] reductase [Branchiibius hedensis]SSA35635.1 3-oxoacyl-[acyl-carrier protein] reductase [Branchiibius hedensis]